MKFLPVLAAGFLAIAMLMESASWWLRAFAPPTQVGLYVSRSNILLYGMRAFLLGFNALVAFFIEVGATPQAIAGALAFAFLLTATVQTSVLSGGGPTTFAMRLTMRAFTLPEPDRQPPRTVSIANKRLFGLATVANIIFGFGMSVPLFVAVLVPQFRLSISYTGQIINIAGMLVVLFYVDQILYRSMDSGTLLKDVIDYSHARAISFLVVGLVFIFISIFL